MKRLLHQFLQETLHRHHWIPLTLKQFEQALIANFWMIWGSWTGDCRD